jgi:hypothetical protein
MEKALRWAIYYDNGSVWCWHEVGEDAGQLPKVGVIAIKQEVILGPGQFPDTRLISGFDYYWRDDKDPDGWGGGDLFGMYDYLTQSGHKVVLFGRTISRERFQRIYDGARLDTWDSLDP